MLYQRRCCEEYAGLKLLSDVILVVLMVFIVALFLGASGLAAKAYSADVEDQLESTRPECRVHDMKLISSSIEMDVRSRTTLVLELAWKTEMAFSNDQLRGTLFIDRSDSPTGCVVACRLDSRKLLESPMLTGRIPIDGDDSRSGFHDIEDMDVQARFVRRN